MATQRITLSGDITAEELERILTLNAAYLTRRDVAMAENFIDASIALLSVPLEEIDHSGERTRLKIAALEKQRDDAIAWLEVERAISSPPVQHVPHRDQRGRYDNDEFDRFDY